MDRLGHTNGGNSMMFLEYQILAGLMPFIYRYCCFCPEKKEKPPRSLSRWAPREAQFERDLRERGPMSTPSQLEITGLPAIAYAVIDQAARDAANGCPTAGAWLLSETAQEYATLAKLENGFLGELASKALERLCYGS